MSSPAATSYTSTPDPIKVAIIEDRRTIREGLELFQQFHPPKHVDYLLTPHELRLLKLLVEGHNYRTAAKEVRTTVYAVSSPDTSLCEW